MNDRNDVLVALICCLTFLVFTIGMFHCVNSRTKIFVENGYTRAVLPGEDYPQWVKDTDNLEVKQ